MIEIKRWDNGEVIHSGDFDSVKECLEDVVKKGICFHRADLRGANLQVADLRGADLQCADLRGANLQCAYLQGADLDFASWHLWCGSTKAIVDDRLSKQLAYHAICVMSDEQKSEYLKDPIAWSNGFHRVGNADKIEQPKGGQDE